MEAVADAVEALKEGAPQVHPDAPNNLCFDWELGDKAATDIAMAQCPSHHNPRFCQPARYPNAIEPRSAIGDYDDSTDKYTLYTTSQNPHLTRLLLCAFVLGIPEHKVRVVAPDVGGGFGSKIFHYTEEALVIWAYQ
jgi:carbon-monoxide dehydrogenase large subunit